MITVKQVKTAKRRIKGEIYETPITLDQQLNLYFKWENRQRTGAFKIRGALNKVLSLSQSELERGLVTCSAGNHGQGIAIAAEKTGTSCLVFASEHAAPVKLDAMRKLGAVVRLVPGGYVQAEQAAIRFAEEQQMTFVSPYNDELVIAGQGTIGLELLDYFGDLSQISSILVPVGGGGLISGIAIALSELKDRPLIIGVQSEASSFAWQLLHKGSQAGVVEEDSIAEGLAGMIDPQSVTIPIMQRWVDDVVLVSEEQIREAIRYSWFNLHEIIEGSAAVGLAAQLAGKIQLSPALTIVTGGNIQPELFDAIIRRN